MEPKLLTFNFTDGTLHDATLSENSESIKLEYDYTWSIQPIPDTIVGTSPLYSIEVSNDDTTWVDYDAASTDLDIVNSVDDDRLAFKYMRIAHDANGVTSGDVTYKILLKD